MKPREVTGSASALAFLFSGGHVMQVHREVDRAKRRAALANTWSRAVMARFMWISPSPRRRRAKAAAERRAAAAAAAVAS